LKFSSKIYIALMFSVRDPCEGAREFERAQFALSTIAKEII